MKYIKSLDGLRTIAVLFVFIYHLTPSFLQAGFIGVDIFFVLSGFLITGVLTGTDISFSGYSHFLFKRAKRLVPAFAFVCIVSSAVAFFYSCLKS